MREHLQKEHQEYNMAHFCELDEDQKVIKTLVFSNEDIDAHGGDLSTGAEEWVSTTPNTAAAKSPTEKAGVSWKQTSYNSSFRKNYGGFGHYYDQTRDAFILVNKPFESWVLDETTCKYVAPQPWPTNNQVGEEFLSFDWNEDNQRFQGNIIPDGAAYYWDNINLQWIGV